WERWMRCFRSWKMKTTWSGKRPRGRCRAWAGPRRARKLKERSMADEAPKLIQIGKGGPGVKKDGFNLISEKVVKVDLEARILEIELLAYEGKTVVLEVGEELLEDLKKLKPGDGVTVRVIEEEPGAGVEGTLHSGVAKRRIVKGFTIRSRDANKTRAEEMLAALSEGHWLTRKYAVEVLGTLGDTRAVGPLIECLMDEVHDIRQRAYDS